jgi:hypothetical protein
MVFVIDVRKYIEYDQSNEEYNCNSLKRGVDLNNR